MNSQIIEEIAKRHGFSTVAVEALLSAFASGGGKMAQFSHPELGGMGQWSGGMLMIGDFSNSALKTRVQALCDEVSRMPKLSAEVHGVEDRKALEGSRIEGSKFERELEAPQRWWPESFGQPGSTGGQNDSAYAYFKGINRLAIKQGESVTVYDTTGYDIYGVSQQQSSSKSISFDCQRGSVKLTDLPTVGTAKI